MNLAFAILAAVADLAGAALRGLTAAVAAFERSLLNEARMPDRIPDALLVDN